MSRTRLRRKPVEPYRAADWRWMLFLCVAATFSAVVLIAFELPGGAVLAMAIAIGTAFGTGYLFRAWLRARTTGPLPVTFRLLEDIEAHPGEPDEPPETNPSAPASTAEPTATDRAGPPILTQVVGAISGAVVIALGVTFFAAGSPLLLTVTVTFGVATLTMSLLALASRLRGARGQAPPPP